MGSVRLKNLKQIGPYLYFRREVAGRDTYIRLPAIDSPEFQAEYERLIGGHKAESRAKAAPGSFAALVSEYRGSPEYKTLKDVTRTNYNRYLEIISSEHGHRPVKTLTRPAVIVLRDRMADTPGKANNFVSVLRTLLNYGIDKGYCVTNAAEKVKKLEIGEHKPWPPELITRALDRCKDPERPRLMLRFAIVTGLCSGQRIEDVITMRHDAMSDGMLTHTQEKTGKEVYIPMHPFWLTELAAIEVRGEYLVYWRNGRPYASPDALQDQIRELMAEPEIVELLDQMRAARKIGRDDSFTFHGLRKNATNYLAETGLTTHQIAAITGMSLEMIEHYTKGVHTRRLAESASEAVRSGRIVALSKPAQSADPVKSKKNAGKIALPKRHKA